jgi:xanthine dehydrogenase accessory factor
MDHNRIPEIALDWHRAGRGAVLATVVGTWGSAPRQAGSQMAVSGDGQIMGSVSGGCVEGDVALAAEEVLQTGLPRLLSYGVSDETAMAAGLACGGRIEVLAEPVGAGLPVAMLEAMVAARAARRALAYAVDLTGRDRALLLPGQDAAADARLRSDRAGCEPDGRFIAPMNPPLRLAVVGAVHIAQALMPMARACGHDALLIDPRSAFANAGRFPGETILDDWPDAALAALGPDARMAVVTLTHDPKLDDPAIRTALRAPVFYIGCLGSVRTHARRVERLMAEGFTAAEIARLHAPVGLAIGAQSPAEIAVSILAQITQVLRKGA